MTTHGATKGGLTPPEYRSWQSMKDRCLRPNNEGYKWYGGRGITVCDRWLESFENFLADMGPKPSPQHTLDRKENNGNYDPDNCRWATKKEQAANRRSNRMITYKGETLMISEWAHRADLEMYVLYLRVVRRGWDFERALNTPVQDNKFKKGHTVQPTHRSRRPVSTSTAMITYKGETLTTAAWARRAGLKEATFNRRVTRYGWDLERALTTPVRDNAPKKNGGA